MLSVFCSPSRYTQGRNATASLGQEIVNLGLEGPALIVAGKSAIALLSGVWQSSLHAAGLTYSILQFGGECSPLEIERGMAVARQSDARIIIGAGGGKVLDTARAVASDLNLPVVNCPTVASSDAPCSALSVVYTDEGVFQEYRIYRRNPDLVLVDTEVIARSPVRLLVAGMGDALATWFEAKVCADGNVRNMRGGASTRSALALAELCYRTLLEDGVAALHALQTQVVTPALDRLVEANTLLSGLARLRILRTGRGTRDSQRPDGGRGDASVFPRRESGVRRPGPVDDGIEAAGHSGRGSRFLNQCRTADYVCRYRSGIARGRGAGANRAPGDRDG